MSEYSWVITRDYIANDAYEAPSNLNAKGVIGPSNVEMTASEIKSHPEAIKFRLYDDDEELYYEGFLVGGCGTEPLDDFGTPNAGAAEIRHLENGVWVSI